MKALAVHGGSCEEQLQMVRLWLESDGCEVVVFDLSYSSNSRQAEALTELIAECDAVIFLANSQISLPDVHVAALARISHTTLD
jgi:hypothetical protein